MHWLKRNIALALGMGMPLALVVVFMLAAWLPQLWVAPPRYDILYLANYNPYGNPYGGQHSLHYHVRGGHVVFYYVGAYYPDAWPKLYRYSPASGSLREISLPAPENLPASTQQATPKNVKIIPIAVPELANVNVDASNRAPDGYEFHSGYDSWPGLVGELFFSPAYRRTATLSRGGNIIHLPNTGNDNRFNSNITFIGWIVP